MSALSILIFAPAVPPVVGGIEMFLGTLTRGLARRGVRVSLLCGNEPEPEMRDAAVGSGGFVRVPSLRTPAGAVPWEHRTFAQAQALHELLDETPVDVIHAASHDTALATAIVAPGHRRVGVITAFGEMATESCGFGRLRSDFVHRLAAIDRYLAWSEYYRRVAISYGIAPEKLRVVLAGVDVEAFGLGDRGRGRELLGVEEGRFLVCCPSRFSARKGQMELARAMREVADLPIDLAMTGSLNSGSPAYLEAVRAELRDAGIDDRVHLLLDVPGERMPDVMTAADIVVQPSHLEGLGGAALEAMSAGVPVLLTHTHGFDEIAEPDETAVMVPPGDPSALAAGLRRMYTDPGLRARVASAGREHAVAHFSAERTIDELLALYEELRDVKQGTGDA